MILAHVDASHWWGPAGWLYRNTPGNLAASAIAFTAGWALKGKQIVKGIHDKLDRHHKELVDLHHITHDAVSGVETPKS